MSNTAVIWRWEQIFYGALEISAKQLLSYLDSNLAPTLRLVGLRLDAPEELQRPEIAIVPAEAEFDTSEFAQVMVRAQQLSAEAKEAKIRHSAPFAQGMHERGIAQRAIQIAVEEVVRQFDSWDGRISFAGFPGTVSDWEWQYLIIPILRIDSAAFGRHGGLQRNTRPIHAYRDVRIATSLLDAALLTFFDTCAHLLAMREPGSDLYLLSNITSSEELLRRSGQRLTQTASTVANPTAVDSLWNVCNAVATMKYEGAETRGRIIASRHDHTSLVPQIRFSTPIPISDYRAIRKLLEMTVSGKDGISLLCDGLKIHGLGRASDAYDSSAEDFFVVNFLADGLWELQHAGRPLMQVRYGRPEIPRPKVSYDQFVKAIKSLEATISTNHIGELWNLIQAAIETGHGTLVVISREASAEADRLQQQAYSLMPEKMSVSLLALTSRIDGAVLLDLEARCHALGVILDGRATPHGNSARGARYNSAVRYVESRRGKCLAVVVSHDGMADLITPVDPV
jgi:hypothetical protein